MSLNGGINAFKSSTRVSWKSTGKLQQTVADCLVRTGRGLHSGKASTVKIWPEIAGEGRYFDFCSKKIPACINYAEESPLCTTLLRDGYRVRTVEHLLSALEAVGADNCRIEIQSSDPHDRSVEVPIFDGSARKWIEAIKQVGLKVAKDSCGKGCEKMAAFVNEPLYASKNDSFVAAFPSPKIQFTYGIDFPQVPAIGCQWFSSTSFNESFYCDQISASRTFCIFEEVEQIRKLGLIKGGSLDNAIVCSVRRGWLNSDLRFSDEPCRHKVLDLIGDLSLFARCGSQGLPVANIVAYKGGHALHTDFVRCMSGV